MASGSLTFLVFIAFGGDEAKKVAEDLGMYLTKIGIPTFVASSKFGGWLIPGQPKFDQVIWKKLQKSDIMVLVSTRKTAYSKKVRKEIFETILSEKPILVVKDKSTRMPFSAKLRESHWVPDDLGFSKRSPYRIFPRVAIQVLRNMEQWAEDKLTLGESK
jgi:hypothetical protein